MISLVVAVTPNGDSIYFWIPKEKYEKYQWPPA